MADAGKTVRLNLTDKDGRVYRLQMPATADTQKTAIPIKKEIIEDEEEASVLCSRCSKAFYNHVALRNHLKLQHNVELAEVEVSDIPRKPTPQLELEIAPTPQRTIKLGDISVEPQQLLKLTSDKVSYIIVKTESFPEQKPRKKRRRAFQEALPKTREKMMKQRVPVEPFKSLQQSGVAGASHQQNVGQAKLEVSDSPKKPKPEPKPKPVPKPEPAPIPQGTIKLGDISVEPQQLLKLASEKVSYIIVKTETLSENQNSETKKRRRAVREDGDTPNTSPRKKLLKERGPVELAGPFECLQHSSSVADAVCHQMFFNCCEYSLHFYKEHNRRRKPGIKCQVCEKRLDAQLAGMEEALVDRQCVHCRLLLPDAGALQEHLRLAHVRPKPFKCTVCSKGFTQQGGLQQHMRMHTGDRPFPCSVCTKAFSQKSGLDQHMRTHTKIKPFRCVVCDKSFVQSIHLKQHMRTHTNITPFQCTLCQGRFKQSSHLKLHLKSHGVTVEGFADHSEVLTATETLIEQQQNLDQLQENPSVYVEESQQEDGTVYVEEGQENDASVYVEVNHEEEPSVYVEENQEEEETSVYVEENQDEEETSVYVEANQEEEESSVYVEENQEEEETSVYVEENQEEEETSVYVEENQEEEETSVYVEENQEEEETSVYVEENQEEEHSAYMEESSADAEGDQEEEASESAEEELDPSVVVEDNNMEEEYIIESSDEMETILS